MDLAQVRFASVFVVSHQTPTLPVALLEKKVGDDCGEILRYEMVKAAQK